MINRGTNKISKQIKSLKERKHRDSEGLFIAEGLRFVNEIPEDYQIEYYAFLPLAIVIHIKQEFWTL